MTRVEVGGGKSGLGEHLGALKRELVHFLNCLKSAFLWVRGEGCAGAPCLFLVRPSRARPGDSEGPSGLVIGRQEAALLSRVSLWMGPSFCFSFSISKNNVELLV